MTVNPWRDVDPVPWDTVTAEGARNPPCETCGSGGHPADIGMAHLKQFCERINTRTPVKTDERVIIQWRCLHCAVQEALERGDEILAWVLSESRDTTDDARRDPGSLSYRAAIWDPPVA